MLPTNENRHLNVEKRHLNVDKEALDDIFHLFGLFLIYCCCYDLIDQSSLLCCFSDLFLLWFNRSVYCNVVFLISCCYDLIDQSSFLCGFSDLFLLWFNREVFVVFLMDQSSLLCLLWSVVVVFLMDQWPLAIGVVELSSSFPEVLFLPESVSGGLLTMRRKMTEHRTMNM